MESMPISLLALPVELSQPIFDQLDDPAIYALRLASRSLQTATIHRFRKALAHRTTDLSTNSLQALIAICEHRHLSSAVQSPTIVASYYDTACLQRVLDTKHPYTDLAFGPVISAGAPCSKAELAQVAARVDLLEQRKVDQVNSALSQSDLMVLTNVLRKASNLRTLTLEAGLYRYPETRLAAFEARDLWRQVWKKATHVYLVTIAAIAESQSSIEELYIYGGKWGCGVPGYDVHASIPHLKARGIEAALANLRILLLNCSTRLIDAVRPLCCQKVPRYPSRRTELYQQLVSKQFVSLVTDNGNYLGPAHLLMLCPNLEELELVQYYLRAPNWCSQRQKVTYLIGCPNVFDNVAQVVQLPRLQRCTIRGQTFTGNAMVQFLKNSPLLKQFELRFANLEGPGIWASVFEQCRKLDTLILRYLYANHMMVYLGGNSTGDERYGLTANHDQLQRGVEYTVSQDGMCTTWIRPDEEGERKRDHDPPM